MGKFGAVVQPQKVDIYTVYIKTSCLNVNWTEHTTFAQATLTRGYRLWWEYLL